MKKGRKEGQKERTFYLLSDDYERIIEVLKASELAKRMGILPYQLDNVLLRRPTLDGHPIAEE